MENTNKKKSKNWKKIEQKIINLCFFQVQYFWVCVFRLVSSVLIIPRGNFLIILLPQHHIICYCESLSCNKTSFLLSLHFIFQPYTHIFLWNHSFTSGSSRNKSFMKYYNAPKNYTYTHTINTFILRKKVKVEVIYLRKYPAGVLCCCVEHKTKFFWYYEKCV